MMEIIEYVDESGVSPFGVWLAHLNDTQAQARIDARIGRLIDGLFGDCKRRQNTDIKQAIALWQDWQQRMKK